MMTRGHHQSPEGQEDIMKSLKNCKWLYEADEQCGDFDRLTQICEKHGVDIFNKDYRYEELAGLPDSPHYYAGQQYIYVRIEFLRQYGRLNK
jgi:hypothetical protein